MNPNPLTPEQIASHYSACLDSVWLINDVLSYPSKYVDDDTVIQRNVQHLEGMRQADFWGDEDMTPNDDAIAVGNAALA